MKQAKTDRRAQRTRQLLNTALVELMLEKRYAAITVQDILERANIGRSTFYTHIYDKDDLLLNDVAALIERLIPHIDQAHGSHAHLLPSLALFEHVDEHRALYTALARGHMLEAVFKAVQAQLVAHIERTLATLPQPFGCTVPPAAVATHLASSLLTLLRWWIDTDAPYTPAQMEAMFQQLVAPGMTAALHGAPQ
ncbi:MAG: TetR/AcrR family transcriptional regulator [Chloroflexales bacterium]|nr:TetR/AcrR family transcriptional regulator [Chloroflexales bacterium]